MAAGACPQNPRSRPDTVTRGSGNGFADLNRPDAEERQTKLWLAHALSAVIDVQRLTQDMAAARLGLNQRRCRRCATTSSRDFR
jgi:hypothetical protein